MNWKLMTTGILGIALGLSFAPYAHKAVSAASEISGTPHFEIQSAIVDELNGQGQDELRHEVFLLDSNSGRIWKFQGLVWGQTKDGSGKVFSEPQFIAIAVDAAKNAPPH